MKTQLTRIYKAIRSFAMEVSRRKPASALLKRLLWAASLLLAVFGAQAAVVFTSQSDAWG